MSPSQVHSHPHSHGHSNLNAFTLQDQLYATKSTALSRNNSYSAALSSPQSTSTDEVLERDTFKLVLLSTSGLFLIYHLPLLVFSIVTVMYLLTWFVYSTYGYRRLTLTTLPLDPLRIVKLNRILFFTNIPTNISLVPVGLALAKYRLWTMRGSKGLIMNIPYNKKRPGKTLDVYVPEHAKVDQGSSEDDRPLLPVVVFIYGGSWCSGSKTIYTLIGAQFRALGYVTVIPDYTTFPGGLVKDMQDDIQMALQWTGRNCRAYGGNPDRIFLMGHSAGAHLSALTIVHNSVKKALKEASTAQSTVLSAFMAKRHHPSVADDYDNQADHEMDDEDDTSLPRIHGMILCSGVYEIGAHLEHEKIRGVEEVSVMSRVMGESPLTFGINSPTTMVQEILRDSSFLQQKARGHLPTKILIVHGAEDKTVPSISSVRLHKALQSLHLDSGSIRLKVFPAMAHQAPVVGMMPSLKGPGPFCQTLLDEYAAFIS
ncbi:prenylcysteine alpha-carboxyl methylesterase [Entomortierella parvispora]|uniref:Prenylcysteine alpha-carboxyl methylesterase n=1 Tax=Entomortierella parvispora TaxID=205924 RepID=A0A9P3HIH1_9FUNG|nr:prenylcysteine alpha-carboxyl methylesterase [Entomortierella parvispora]